MFKFVRIAALLMLTVVVAACSGEAGAGDPTDAAKNYMAAIAEMDSAKVAPLLCKAQADQANQMAEVFGTEGLEMTMDVSGLTYEATNVTDTTALVKLNGTLKITMMGQEVDQPASDLFGEGIPMIKEDGDWKLCPPAA